MITLNALAATSVRMLVPWSGPWIADVAYDLGAAGVEAKGAAILTIDRETFAGTIAPSESGHFGSKGRGLLVAGGGGWDKIVEPRDYVNDGGVLSTNVLATTAAEVGERVVELAPSRLGVKYVRPAGSASRVLAGLDWHVDATGTTIVGPRPTLPAATTVQVLDWDPDAQLATLSADELVVPGTILTDSRFGQVLVRDVEQRWDDAGARTKAWCMAIGTKPVAAGSRILAALGAAAREAVGLAHLKSYRYRVGTQGPDGRVKLQAVSRTAGIPDQALVPIAYGVPGASAKLKPGSIVHVHFPEADPTQAFVTAFETSTGVELSLEATLALSLSAQAIALKPGVGGVAVGAGRAPVALMTQSFATWITAVTTALNALAPGSAVAPLDAASTATRSD